MADFSPFPELLIEDQEAFANLDPELELSRGFEDVQESAPFGVSWRIDFAKGDLAVSEGGYVPAIDGHDSLNQWAMQTCLTERFESPLLSENIGLEVRTKHIGETITTARMLDIARQVVGALKAHDRITRVFVQRVFSVANDIYLTVRYETDDGEDEFLLVGV